MDKEASEDEIGKDDADRNPDEGGEEEQQEDGGARQHQRLVQKNCQIKEKKVKENHKTWRIVKFSNCQIKEKN